MNEVCKSHVDACRFCWMCRHICPIGNATGLERNTARARALGLSLVNRGTYDLSQVADNLYECAGCGACTKECVTGWDPVMFTEAAKTDVALEGKLPPYIQTLVEQCLNTGNAYGKTTLDASLTKAIGAHAQKTDTLLFLGVDARYMAPDSAIRAIRALEKAGVTFTVLQEEKPSGQQLAYLIGAMDETKRQMQSCADTFRDYQTVIFYDPQDALACKRKYGEYGVKVDAELVTYTAVLAARLRDGALSPVKKPGKAAYQDPFQLARDLGETEEGREIVRVYREQTEMLMHGKDTMWAGNILMALWLPKAIAGVSENRIENARAIGADTIVTASVSEYTALRKVAQDQVKILSVEELILE